MPHDLLASAHNKAAEALQAAQFRWNAAKGPFTATILTAKRLGWSFVSAEILTTDDGETIDLTRDSPAYVRDQVRGSVRRKVASEIDDIMPMLRSRGRGPVTKGIRRALRKNRKA